MNYRQSDSASNNSYAGSHSTKLQKHREATKYGAGGTGHELSHISKKGKEPLKTTAPSQRSTRLDLDRNDVVNSRQSWRDRKPTLACHDAIMRVSSPSEQTLGNYIHDGTGSSECEQSSKNQDILIESIYIESPGKTENTRKPSQLLEETSGKSDTSQQHGLVTSQGDKSNYSNSDEAVLVYYGAGEVPQRHRLEDCARLRASTPGCSDSTYYDRILADYRNNETKVKGQLSIPLQPLSTQHTQESGTTPDKSNGDPQRVHDKPVRKFSKDHDVEEHTGDEDTSQTGIIKSNAADVATQHRLAECAEIVPVLTPSPAERKALEHSLYQCTAESANESEASGSERATTKEHTKQQCMDNRANDPETDETRIQTRIQKGDEPEALNDDDGNADTILIANCNGKHNEGEPHYLSGRKPVERENISAATSSENPPTQDDILASQDSMNITKLPAACRTAVPSKATVALSEVLGEGTKGVNMDSGEVLSTASAPDLVIVVREETNMPAGVDKERLV
jgi:hypothetical protein